MRSSLLARAYNEHVPIIGLRQHVHTEVRRQADIKTEVSRPSNNEDKEGVTNEKCTTSSTHSLSTICVFIRSSTFMFRPLSNLCGRVGQSCVDGRLT